MLKGANSSEVVKAVKERMIQINKSLPEGVVAEAFIDRSKLVNNAISTVAKNLIEGALIVIFVLSIIFRKFKSRTYCCFCYSFSNVVCSYYDECLWC
jgi:cobalt-zinc-cadmium resistance protein CzcA